MQLGMTCSLFLPEALYWGVQLFFCPVGLRGAPDLASATAVHSRGSAPHQGSTAEYGSQSGAIWKCLEAVLVVTRGGSRCCSI